MNIQITTFFDSPSFSSSVREIKIASDCPYVRVRISSSAHPSTYILDEVYYPINGFVIVRNLGHLFTDYMKRAKVAITDFTVYADYGDQDVSKTFTAIHCDRAIYDGLGDFHQYNFLTALDTRRVPPGEDFCFYFYNDYNIGGYPVITVFVRDPITDERLKVSDRIYYREASKKHPFFFVDIRWYQLENIVSEAFGERQLEITHYVLTFETYHRNLTFIVDPSLKDARRFYFKNRFNIEEKAFFHDATTVKFKVEQSAANINGQTKQYNRSQTREFEEATAPLSLQEAEWMEDFLYSSDVSLDTGPVLITESTCEYSTDKPGVVKFTWRHAENTPPYFCEYKALAFNDKFNDSFS